MNHLPLTILAVALSVVPAAARRASVTSPDGHISATLDDSTGHITLEVLADGETLLAPSPVSLSIAGVKEASRIRKARPDRNVKSEHIIAPFYRQKEFDISWRPMTASLDNGTAIELRAFDDGVAYRYVTALPDSITVSGEKASYRFPGNPQAWIPYSTNEKNPLAMAFQNYYTQTPLGSASPLPAFLPLTVAPDSIHKLTFLESDLISYPGMFLSADSTSCSLEALFAGYPAATDFYPWRRQLYVTAAEPFIARTAGKRTFPWRIIAVTDNDREMPVNNLVYALATPSKVADTSWIRPGKVAWDWWNDWDLTGVPFDAGINTATYRHYIDFAADHGIEYVVLDEGWYDPRSGDMLTVIPDIDLPQLIAYGKERGVGIVLWTVFNVLDSQLEEACSKYAAMGVKGFKVDFLDRDDQTAVEMTWRLAEAAARHHLLLDYHGIYKPVGLSRAFPNVLNYEGVFGLEEVKWTDPATDFPRYDVTFPFIRQMAGQSDYTPGAMRNATRRDWHAIYSHPVSMGTRAHQLASYIIHDSPFTMLCDSPSSYEGEEPCVQFISSLPVTFDSTAVVDGRMGEYIVTARRSNGSWFVGAATDWEPRNLELPLSFLAPGVRYKATYIADGPNAHRNATDHVIATDTVTDRSVMPIKMASGGGFVMKLTPLAPSHTEVTGIPSHMTPIIDPFYKKYIDVDGLYAVSSGAVSDEALMRAADIMAGMLMKRPDIQRHMASRGGHVLIIGRDEQTCDIPEYRHVCTDDPDSIAYINWRARGFGGAPEDMFSSGCGEENLLALPTDRYTGENILVHEFAHLIHMLGIAEVEPDFNDRLTALFESARAKGLWNNTYALSNIEEYFAESVQSWFNCNRYASPSNGVHNTVNRREKLRAYDPDMYRLLSEYFYETDLPIINTIHP